MLYVFLVLAFMVSASLAGPRVPPLHNDCPDEGVFAWADDKTCDGYHKCENGTYSAEICPNGLLFAGKHSVYDFCNYNWAITCPEGLTAPGPISSPGCPWQFGIFHAGSCTEYNKCEWGQPILSPCEPGLAFEDSIHKCNWPDEVEGCDSEAIVGFKCPAKVTGLSVKFIPFPRYPYPGDCTRLITCVNDKPRLIGCGEGSAFNQDTYACDDIKNVPECHPYYKK